MTDGTSTVTDSRRAQRFDESSSTDLAVVLLLMAPGEDRRLLRDMLATEYDVHAATSPDDVDVEYDLCLAGEDQFRDYREAIDRQKRLADPTFLPVLLTVPAGSPLRSDPDVWQVADDVVSMPVRKVELHARIQSLVERRRESLELADRERQLATAMEDLQIKERAMDAAPVGITITDPDREDNPLVYANEAFLDLTGYDETEVLGQNCRFLQGPDTDPDTVDRIRAGIDAQRPVSVEIRNYERCGRQFWNGLDIAPVHDEAGTLTHYVGFQTDVTERRIREQRLSVLNRILRHNIRNGLGAVRGYARMLQNDVEDPTHRDHLERIQASASELVELSQTVHDVERRLEQLEAPESSVPVGTALREIVASVERDHQPGEIELRVEDDVDAAVPHPVTEAFRTVVDATAESVAPGDPEPEVVVSQTDASHSQVEVRVIDRGTGLPETERNVVDSGEETPLEHPDGLGLWVAEWIIRSAGGTIEISQTDSGGTEVCIRLPNGGNDDSITN